MIACKGKLHGNVLRICCGRRNTPPAPAISERFTSGIPNFVVSVATTKSHKAATKAAGAKALGCRNQRFGRAVLGQTGKAAAFDNRGFTGQEAFQIHARTEGATGPGQNRDANIGIPSRGLPLRQSRVTSTCSLHFCLRPVHGHGHYAVFDHNQQLFAHLSVSLESPQLYALLISNTQHGWEFLSISQGQND